MILFYKNINKFVTALWGIISPLEDVLVAIFFGKAIWEADNNEGAIKLFDTLNIEGMNGFEDTILPLLRGFGLDAILSYLNTADANGAADGDDTYLEVLNAKRATRYNNTAASIPAMCPTSNECFKTF